MSTHFTLLSSHRLTPRLNCFAIGRLINRFYVFYHRFQHRLISRRPAHLSMLSWRSFTILPKILFPSQWLLSHITIFETMDIGKRGMDHVAMTIINPRKEYWPSPGLEPETSCSQVLYSIE